MEATIRKEDNHQVTLILDGRLDTSVTQQTEKEVEPLYDFKDTEIVIDCSRLEYISSSGLRIFLAILKNAKPKGSHVFIRGLNDDLRQVFAMTGFTNLFEFK